MRVEYNSVLSTPIEVDTDILVKPKSADIIFDLYWYVLRLPLSLLKQLELFLVFKFVKGHM